MRFTFWVLPCCDDVYTLSRSLHQSVLLGLKNFSPTLNIFPLGAMLKLIRMTNNMVLPSLQATRKLAPCIPFILQYRYPFGPKLLFSTFICNSYLYKNEAGKGLD